MNAKDQKRTGILPCSESLKAADFLQQFVGIFVEKEYENHR
jgi:hypothetical protein